MGLPGFDSIGLVNRSAVYLQILHLNTDLYTLNGVELSTFSFEDAMALVEANELELVPVAA